MPSARNLLRRGLWGLPLLLLVVLAGAVAGVVETGPATAPVRAATATATAAGPVRSTLAPVRPIAAAVSTAPQWRSVDVHGVVRHFLLAAPSTPGRHPLLVVLHGLNQRTPAFLTTTGVVPDALAAGVVVAAPETPDASWNDGRFGGRGRDDVGYVAAIVDRLVADGLVDPTRVTVAGFSNGAGLAMDVASRHPHLPAALLLVGGELLSGPGAPRPLASMDTVLVHGTADPIQPWAGRRPYSQRWPGMIGVPATVQAFLQADGLTGAPLQRLLPHRAGRVPVAELRWSGPAGEVSLYRMEGAGHVWPVSSCVPRGCLPGRSFARPADVSATTLAVHLAATSGLAGPGA